jgi:hypothetical protein
MAEEDGAEAVDDEPGKEGEGQVEMCASIEVVEGHEGQPPGVRSQRAKKLSGVRRQEAKKVVSDQWSGVRQARSTANG